MTADARRAYVAALMDRLRQQYAARAPLPDCALIGCLSLAMLQRLYRCIMAEGYGE